MTIDEIVKLCLQNGTMGAVAWFVLTKVNVELKEIRLALAALLERARMSDEREATTSEADRSRRTATPPDPNESASTRRAS